jgi:hypothetical protein
VLLADIDQPASRVDMIAKVATLIRANPALQAREREVTARYTARLAHLFTAETGVAADNIEAWAAASALMAAHQGLLQYVRNAVLAGRRGTRLTTDAAAQASRALSRLESGLADFPTNSR